MQDLWVPLERREKLERRDCQDILDNLAALATLESLGLPDQLETLYVSNMQHHLVTMLNLPSPHFLFTGSPWH